MPSTKGWIASNWACAIAGSNYFWVDPERDLTDGYPSTGLMREAQSTPRHQRISDLVQAVVVD